MARLLSGSSWSVQRTDSVGQSWRNVTGAATDETVTLNGFSLGASSLLDLGGGNDTAILNKTGTWAFTMKNVEWLKAGVGKDVDVRVNGNVAFKTDGSLKSIKADSGNQTVTFVSALRNSTIDLGSAMDTVVFSEESTKWRYEYLNGNLKVFDLETGYYVHVTGSNAGLLNHVDNIKITADSAPATVAATPNTSTEDIATGSAPSQGGTLLTGALSSINPASSSITFDAGNYGGYVSFFGHTGAVGGAVNWNNWSFVDRHALTSNASNTVALAAAGSVQDGFLWLDFGTAATNPTFFTDGGYGTSNQRIILGTNNGDSGGAMNQSGADTLNNLYNHWWDSTGTNGYLFYAMGGNDVVLGNSKADTVYGGSGDDSITGNGGADKLYGEAGADVFYGFAGADTIDGGTESDTLEITATSADLNGAADAQIQGVENVTATNAVAAVNINLGLQSDGFTIVGSEVGADTIVASTGADTLTLGSGADRVQFGTNGSLAGAMDTITDYALLADILDFGGSAVLLGQGGAVAEATGVSTSANGKVTFHANDNNLAKKIIAIQADGRLDQANSVAIFNDGTDSYVYYAGAAAGNADDQLVRIKDLDVLDKIVVDGNGDITLDKAPTYDWPLTSRTLLGSKTLTGGTDGASSAGYTLSSMAARTLIDPTAEAGFGTSIGNGDDYFRSVDISAVFGNGLNFFNNVSTPYYTTAYMGSNGYITFARGYSGYVPSGVPGFTYAPMIAGQFDDLYTVAGRNVAGGDGFDGISAGSGTGYYYVDTANHRVIFTWDNLGLYSSPANGGSAGSGGAGSAFQIILHQQDADEHTAGFQTGSSNFGIEIRYEDVRYQYSTTNAGWTAGDQFNYATIDNDNNSGTAYDLNNAVSDSNVGVAGVWAWNVRGGVVEYKTWLPDLKVSGTGEGVDQINVMEIDVQAGGPVGSPYTPNLSDDDGGRFTISSVDGDTFRLTTVAGSKWNLWKEDYKDGKTEVWVGASGTGGFYNPISFEIDIYASNKDVVTRPTDTSLVVTATSADLNSALNVDLTTVTSVSAASASAGVNLNLGNQLEGFVITGSGLGDTLVGGQGVDNISAGNGDDTITGGAGADSLDGGAGADVLVFASAAELDGDATVIGGTLSDTIRLDTVNAALSLSDSDFDKVREVEVLALNGNGTQSVTLGANTDAAFAAGITITTQATATGLDLEGALSSVFINATGTNNNDTLTGGTVGDTLIGGWGDDTITGGAGADNLDGGNGDDVFVIANAADIDGLAETIDGGTHAAGDRIRVDSQTANISAATVSNIEILQSTYVGSSILTVANSQLGSGKITEVTTAIDVGDTDVLQTNDNTLDVSGVTLTGIDTLSVDADGNNVNDTITVDTATLAAVTNITASGVADTNVLTTAAAALDVSAKTLTNIDELASTNAGVSIFTVANAQLASGGGSVTAVTAGATLNIDRLQTNDSTLDVSGVSLTNIDTLTVDADNNSAGAQTITVVGSQVDSTDAAKVSTITSGNAGATVTLQLAAAGTLALDGVTLTNIDQIYGSSGDDSITWNDATGAVSIDGGSGDDSIDQTGGGALTLADTLYGGDGDDTIYGGDGNDIIGGGNNDDVLYGEDGDDTITGGAGADNLTGGNGADTFVQTHSTAAVITETHVGSTHTLTLSGTYNVGDVLLFGNFNPVPDNYGSYEVKAGDTLDMIAAGFAAAINAGTGRVTAAVGGGSGQLTITEAPATSWYGVSASYQADTITDFATGSDVLELSAAKLNLLLNGNPNGAGAGDDWLNARGVVTPYYADGDTGATIAFASFNGATGDTLATGFAGTFIYDAVNGKLYLDQSGDTTWTDFGDVLTDAAGDDILIATVGVITGADIHIIA